jgi:hypothetical protein
VTKQEVSLKPVLEPHVRTLLHSESFEGIRVIRPENSPPRFYGIGNYRHGSQNLFYAIDAPPQKNDYYR